MKKALLLVAPLMFTLMMTSSSMLATGCGGGGSGGSGGSGGGSGGGTGGGTADGGTDFTCDASPNAETAQTVFTKTAQANCANCHFPPTGTGLPYGDYSTADKMYMAMVNHASIYDNTAGGDSLKMVIPNDLAHSTVWIKLICTAGATNCKSPHGSPTGAAMPYQTNMQLSATDLKVFKDWICTGAKQN